MNITQFVYLVTADEHWGCLDLGAITKKKTKKPTTTTTKKTLLDDCILTKTECQDGIKSFHLK